MQLREYITSDCEQLAKLFYQTVHSVNAKDYTSEQLDVWATGKADLTEWNKTFLEHYTIVAVEHDEIVGFGDIDKTGYLDRLFVHKDHQGKGIASAICDTLEQWARKGTITTHASITAKPFFEKRGYHMVREQQVNRNDIILINYLMKKTMIIQLDETSVDDFWRLRKGLFEELGEISQNTDISELKLKTEQYFLTHINRDLMSWGMLQEDKLVAIGSLCLFSRIPYFENLSGLEGYILNIYTLPQFRKCGLANQILENIIEYSRKNNIKKLWLNSSEQGESLYVKAGFVKKNNEMELFP